MDKKLEKYYKRLQKEAIIKSLIFGLIICFSVILILSIVFFAFQTKQILISIIIGFVSLIISSVLIYNYKYKPDLKQIAKRVDEMGLEERVITMVEFKDENGFIYKKQRENTEYELGKINDKDFKLKFSKPSFFVLGVVIVLGLSSFALPKLENSNSSFGSLPPITSEPPVTSEIIPDQELDEDKIIAELLEKLRELIANSAVGKDFKEELYAIVDQLEEDIKKLNTLTEKIEAISKAREEIKKKIEEELLRLSIGRCLKKFEITAELGNVIIMASSDESKIPQVGEALNRIKERLKNSNDYEQELNKLIAALDFAIETATKEKNTLLVEAIINFRNSLIGETARKKSSIVLKILDVNNIDSVFDKTNEEIQEALKKNIDDTLPEQGESEKDVEDLGESIDQAFADAEDQLKDLKEEDNNSDDSSKEDGDGTNPPPTFDDGNLESDTVIDGETPYLNVYEEYYEEIMAYLSGNEDIPEDIREIIEKYLEMINGEGNK